MPYVSQELDFVNRIRALVPEIESLRGKIKKEMCYYFGEVSTDWTTPGVDLTRDITMGITVGDALEAMTTIDMLNNALTDAHMGNLNNMV